MTLSRSPQYRAFSRAVMDEKSLSPLFPVGGGTVVTNDWCIMPLVSISKISSLYLVYVAAQAGLCINWSQTWKIGFLVMMLIIRTFHKC